MDNVDIIRRTGLLELVGAPNPVSGEVTVELVFALLEADALEDPPEVVEPVIFI